MQSIIVYISLAVKDFTFLPNQNFLMPKRVSIVSCQVSELGARLFSRAQDGSHTLDWDAQRPEPPCTAISLSPMHFPAHVSRVCCSDLCRFED